MCRQIVDRFVFGPGSVVSKEKGSVMKTVKKILYSLVLTMMIVLVSPTVLPLPGQITQVEAAVKLSKKTVTLIKGQTTTLKISGTKKKVKWASDKKSVAVVSQKGKVVAKNKGTATISATVGKKKYTCTVVVQTPKMSKSKLTLTKGETEALKLNGTDQKITWKSSNKNIASVDKNGKITAKKKGTVTITATVLKKKYTCKVTVKNPKNTTSGQTDSSTSGLTGSTDDSTVSTGTGEVWIPTNGGTKYHATSTCSRMVDPDYVTVEKAIELGFTACKKCY